MTSLPDRPQPAQRRAVVPAALLAAGLAAAVCAADSASADTRRADPVATIHRLAGELDLQTRLPRQHDDARDPVPSDFKIGIPGARAILWSALAVGLAFALYALRDKLPGFRRRAPAPPAARIEEVAAEVVGRMAAAGDDADDLARAGRIGEAMHLLLLRALTEMCAKLGVALADSLTSREILGRIVLPDGGRQALGELIGRVELAHFGGRPVTPDDYRACRGTYERLLGTLLASPAALPAV